MNIKYEKWNSCHSNFEKQSNIKSIKIYESQQMTSHDICVIIPTYQRANLLRYAIDSVKEQNYKGGNFESVHLIVLDNCDDIDKDTDLLMKEYTSNFKNITYYRNEKNIGLLGNWNRAIELCDTEYFVMLHDDDGLKKSYVQNVFKVLNENRGKLDILCVHRQLIDENNKLERRTELSNKDKELINKTYQVTIEDCINSFMPYLAGSVMKKSSCESVGGFDEQFILNDRFFVAKMALYHTIKVLPEVLYEYRIGVNQGTNDFEKIKEITAMSKELVFQMCSYKKYSLFKRKLCCTCECIMQGRGLLQLYADVDLQYIFGEDKIFPVFRIKNKKIYGMIQDIAYKRHEKQRRTMYQRKGCQ